MPQYCILFSDCVAWVFLTSLKQTNIGVFLLLIGSLAFQVTFSGAKFKKQTLKFGTQVFFLLAK